MSKQETWDRYMGEGDFASLSNQNQTIINSILFEYGKQQCIDFFNHLKKYASYGDNTPEQLFGYFIDEQQQNKDNG